MFPDIRRVSYSLPLLLGLVAGPAAADPAGEKAVFGAAQTLAKQSDLELCRYGSLGAGAFALLRDRKQPESIQLAQAIFQLGGTTWTLRIKETGTYGSRCTATGYPPKLPLSPEHVETVTVSDLDEIAPAAWTLGFHGNQLVIREEVELRNAPAGTDDWVSLRNIWSAGSEPGEEAHESAYVLVLPRGAADAKTLPRTSTYVTLGKQEGAGDADLDVKAELDGPKLRLTVAVTDDKDVPLAAAGSPDADLLRSDHVELWFQVGPGRSPANVRQLGVVRLADGSAHARWLHPRKVTAPLPAVTAPAPGRFTIELDAAALIGRPGFDPAVRHQLPFTAVFSDTDARGKRQQTVVATSQLKWGKPASFGALIWFESGARFPPLRSGSRAELDVSR